MRPNPSISGYGFLNPSIVQGERLKMRETLKLDLIACYFEFISVRFLQLKMIEEELILVLTDFSDLGFFFRVIQFF